MLSPLACPERLNDLCWNLRTSRIARGGGGGRARRLSSVVQAHHLDALRLGTAFFVRLQASTSEGVRSHTTQPFELVNDMPQTRPPVFSRRRKSGSE
jgi:hypothetical protein